MPGHPYKIYDKSKIQPRVLLDFYPTPRVAVDMLIKHTFFDGSVWEPASGNGAISRILEEQANLQVRSSDIQANAYGEGGLDFLKCDDPTDNVITNPPYSLLNPFMLHSLKVAKFKVAFLVNIHALYGVARHSFYEKNPPSTVLVLSRGIPFFKQGEWQSSGGMKHAWLIWDKADLTGETHIKWALHTGKAITPYDRDLTAPDADCVPMGPIYRPSEREAAEAQASLEAQENQCALKFIDAAAKKASEQNS